MPAAKIRLAFCTAPSEEVGLELARQLVRAQLAACVNLVPRVRSIYRWDDDVQEDDEVLLVIKTDDKHLQELIATVRRLHPYDVPELVAWPLSGGSPEYLDWVQRSLGDGG